MTFAPVEADLPAVRALVLAQFGEDVVRAFDEARTLVLDTMVSVFEVEVPPLVSKPRHSGWHYVTVPLGGLAWEWGERAGGTIGSRGWELSEVRELLTGRRISAPEDPEGLRNRQRSLRRAKVASEAFDEHPAQAVEVEGRHTWRPGQDGGPVEVGERLRAPDGSIRVVTRATAGTRPRGFAHLYEQTFAHVAGDAVDREIVERAEKRGQKTRALPDGREPEPPAPEPEPAQRQPPRFKVGDEVWRPIGAENSGMREFGAVEGRGEYDEFLKTYRYRVRSDSDGRIYHWNEPGMAQNIPDPSVGGDLDMRAHVVDAITSLIKAYSTGDPIAYEAKISEISPEFARELIPFLRDSRLASWARDQVRYTEGSANELESVFDDDLFRITQETDDIAHMPFLAAAMNVSNDLEDKARAPEARAPEARVPEARAPEPSGASEVLVTLAPVPGPVWKKLVALAERNAPRDELLRLAWKHDLEPEHVDLAIRHVELQAATQQAKTSGQPALTPAQRNALKWAASENRPTAPMLRPDPITRKSTVQVLQDHGLVDRNFRITSAGEFYLQSLEGGRP